MEENGEQIRLASQEGPQKPTIILTWDEEKQAPHIAISGFKNHTFVRMMLETASRWAENQEKAAQEQIQIQAMRDQALAQKIRQVH